MLTVEGLSKTINGEKVLNNISFIVGHNDKIAFVGSNELAKTTLFQILMGELEPDEGSFNGALPLPRLTSPRTVPGNLTMIIPLPTGSWDILLWMTSLMCAVSWDVCFLQGKTV